MTQSTLKLVLSLLLVASGVLHLVIAGVGAGPEWRAPLGVFGVVYFALGVWTRVGGRPAVIVAVMTTALGMTLGAARYLEQSGPSSLPLLFLLDIGAIAVGTLWLLKDKKKSGDV